jgi:hypothetical protein
MTRPTYTLPRYQRERLYRDLWYGVALKQARAVLFSINPTGGSTMNNKRKLTIGEVIIRPRDWTDWRLDSLMGDERVAALREFAWNRKPPGGMVALNDRNTPVRWHDVAWEDTQFRVRRAVTVDGVTFHEFPEYGAWIGVDIEADHTPVQIPMCEHGCPVVGDAGEVETWDAVNLALVNRVLETDFTEKDAAR